MKIDFDPPPGVISIAAYGPGWIRVRDQRIEAPCVVAMDGVHRELLPARLEELGAEHLDRVLALGPEIVLLGTGARQRFVDVALVARLAAAGVALEMMDTGAACRLFNILSSEDRAVAAALFML
jgi:uncharacterized protein